MHRKGWFLAALILAAACSKSEQNAQQMSDGMGMMGPAEYTIIVKGTWIRANHPFEYPAGAHFSGLIGTTHDTSYTLFAAGAIPTPGLENLSEEGKHTPLDQEIRAAIAAGNAGMMIETAQGLRNFQDSLVTTARVDDTHPLISVVAMVAPSPDWFTGIANVSLAENGAWAASRTLPLYAWDSGGDDGTTYKAPNQDNEPNKPSSQAMTRHFVTNGAAVPVGTITFIKR